MAYYKVFDSLRVDVFVGKSNSIIRRLFSKHEAHPSWILSNPYGTQASQGVIPKYRNRNNI